MASYGSNAIQGAGTGAAAGAAFGPWGALIGGGVGLAASRGGAGHRGRFERCCRCTFRICDFTNWGHGEIEDAVAIGSTSVCIYRAER